MASGSVFSEALQTITTTKLEELAKQRDAFDKEHAAVLAAAKAEKDPLARLIGLIDGTKSCLGVKTHPANDGRAGKVISGGTNNRRLETDLKNLDRFLEQARFDPSVSEKVLEDWEKILLQYLSVQANKYQYADLYGKLVTEWLSSEKAVPVDDDVEMAESFEELPGAKKLAARTEWEKSVFEPADVDVDALKAYLEQLFITDKEAASTAIKKLRDKVERFETDLVRPGQFNVPTLRWVIQGLQASDLLPNEKREVLKDFLSNDVILGEIGDVLSMRLSALNRWSWGDHVPLEQRRKMNGTFSIHMHEDVLQAIFLHYIGVKWSVFFKHAFLNIRWKDAWKNSRTQVSKNDRLTRNYYLGRSWMKTNDTLDNTRDDRHRNNYFAHQLLDYDTQDVEVAEGEEEAEYGDYVQTESLKRKAPRTKQTARKSTGFQAPRRQLASMAARRSVPHGAECEEECEEEDDDDMGFGLFDGGDDDYDNHPPQNYGPKKPMEAKQDLLHILSTEIIINTRLHGELSCFRTVFESWNPLLPHETVLEVLSFFGVSEKWKAFFTKFLQAPLKFMEDGAKSEPRLRRRGTPGSHALSDVFGETVLFCMDFAVNQATDGALLHRLYDDVWFWNKDFEKCVKAWECVEQFTSIMGVELDDKKTGSVRVASTDPPLDDRLPAGEIRWGFLVLSPSTGKFEIDQTMVDGHISELRSQLAGKSKSVIDWIQAWNSYAATFFSSNFGKPSNCFGRDHVDAMLSTHRRIQSAIFEGGNVISYLKSMIATRFNVHSIPDGFFFFPVELGGLDLKSPFVNLLQIRESVRSNPYDLLDDLLAAEKSDYARAKKIWENSAHHPLTNTHDEKSFSPPNPQEFIPFEQFTAHRASYDSGGSSNLLNTYKNLLYRPSEIPVEITPQIRQALDALAGQPNLKGIHAGTMDAYWRWISQMYGPEMFERFGGLGVVEGGLLPVGMVGYFRERRVKWMG